MQESRFRILAVVILLSFAVFFNGCATMNDVVRVKEAGTEGTTKVYPVNTDQAWEISKAVFRWEGSDAIEEHRNEGYMLTSSGMNFVSCGAVMGAWIEPVDTDNTKVTVVTKRRITINIATTLTEATYHKRFAQAVEIVKKGQPLPKKTPD
jgi:PBP1b-binding outer membrane lipoprotein LpoB